MSMTASPALLLDALAFAAHKHRDQRRKNATSSPYINHPIEVARLLAVVGGVHDADVLRAAILHDTVEDTQTTREELAAQFGDAVCAMVLEVTDDKSLEKAERKALQISHSPHLSTGAKLIKFGDKISNVQDVTRDPPADWSTARRAEYLDWTASVIAGCRGVNDALEAYYDDALRTGRAALAGDPQHAG
jgi:(p)ppGpp synthase/HD superfamily hydrolase